MGSQLGDLNHLTALAKSKPRPIRAGIDELPSDNGTMAICARTCHAVEAVIRTQA
jgi:hypothetical protein